MRSVAQAEANRLVDEATSGITRRLGSILQFLRSSVAANGRAAQLTRPAVFWLGAGASRKLTGIIRRASALVQPAADAISVDLIDLTPADANLALDIYSGVFMLDGQIVSTHGRSIFTRAIPSRRFQHELNGFGWLRHLAEAGTPLALLNARALIEDWIDLQQDRAQSQVNQEPSIMATRLRSFLAYADWLLDGASSTFCSRLLAQVTRDFRLLRRTTHRCPGVTQIKIAASLAAASIAVPAFRRCLSSACRQLDAELKRQVLPDGGHISRNPSAIVAILAEILPLKRAFAEAGTPASDVLMNSIDRMLPMLRFFSMPGGVLAHFNGAAPVNGDLIDAILAADDAHGRAHGNASHSGYQRLEAAGTVAIMDSGLAPPAPYADRAHAGTLAFEFASRTNRVVVNCGTSTTARSEWRAVARETAAHSTVVVANRSSSTPIEVGFVAHILGPTLLDGPKTVSVDRREHGGATAVVASHDGYAASHDLIHERTLRLSANGDRIDGRDLLIPAANLRPEPVDFVARFHLDPAIEPVVLTNGVVMLIAADGEAWEFHTDGIMPILEDLDHHLADPAGSVATRQIVLAGSLPEVGELRWTFVRTRSARMTGHA